MTLAFALRGTLNKGEVMTDRLLMLVALFLPLLISAAEKESAPIETDESTENEFLTEPLDDESQEPVDETSEVARDENFVPTIRITEDLPVAFPVDI